MMTVEPLSREMVLRKYATDLSEEQVSFPSIVRRALPADGQRRVRLESQA